MIYQKLIFFLKSFIILLKFWKKHKDLDIIFYYPSHFNRGTPPSNRYFEPMYRACINSGLSYLIIEEPSSKFSKRDLNALPFDNLFYLVILLRKLFPQILFDSFESREWFIGRLFKKTILRGLRFKNCIVLSNSMTGFFRGLSPQAKIYDYQHGLISSDHTGYFLGKDLPDHIKLNQTNLLLFGEGFTNLVQKYDSSNYYAKHAFTIGCTNYQIHPGNNLKKFILFSLQFSEKNNDKDNLHFQFIKSLLSQLEKALSNKNIVLLLKHHPRYEFQLEESLFTYPFTRIYQNNLDQALEKSFLHITLNSTSTFDAARFGIPTILVKNPFFTAEPYSKEFKYPIPLVNDNELGDALVGIIENIQIYESYSKAAQEWVKKFYQPFDNLKFCKLISES